MATAQFRFDTPQLAAGRFILWFKGKLPDGSIKFDVDFNPTI
jgi:hypothetical protein